MNFEYTTDRLILRVLNDSYAAAALAFQTRDAALFERYEPTRPGDFYTIQYQKALLRSEYKQATQMSSIRFYIFKRSNPSLIIGTVCLHDVRRLPYACCEIGYKISSDYQRMGYATEAIGKCIEIAFYELSLHRIFARVMSENTASISLLTSIGFTYEGTEAESALIRGRWCDHELYALINRS
jgi:ribosomal-protein-alanine N-acetyltransferase